MDKSKEDFFKPLYHNPDSDDDDLDNFADFRNRCSQSAIQSQDPGNAGEPGPPMILSQVSAVSSTRPSSTTQLPDNLRKNYISGTDQFNKWLKLTKKELVTAKTAKLKGLVLFYWPAYTTPRPGKNRRRAYVAAIQHGGEIAINWDDALRITHIVVEPASRGREYKDVLQNLKLGRIPDNVQLVTSGWVDEMLQPKHVARVLSEHQFRISGYPSITATPPNIAEARANKRSASNTLVRTIPCSRFRRFESLLPGLKRYKTDDDQIVAATQVIDTANDDPGASDSPKLMKQSLHANFGAQLGARLRDSGLKFKVPDDMDRAIEQIQNAKSARQVSSYSSHTSDKLTADGENIDRLHKTNCEDKDELDGIGEESDKEGLLNSKAKAGPWL